MHTLRCCLKRQRNTVMICASKPAHSTIFLIKDWTPSRVAELPDIGGIRTLFSSLPCFVPRAGKHDHLNSLVHPV
ncbi:hypothetical protein FHW16_002638 [Phyllobacterium myrsinacearum]|uniref:Uncharacterized protein n=1 Tax=Phyllobacterium myrsinacearum TaxID=28101 RepID=A0A839EQM3_9HYPH|nr:hypothetical protein [Phyllobacterium myrsinacearum]